MDPLLTRIIQRIMRLSVGVKVGLTVVIAGILFAFWIVPNLYFHVVDTVPSADAFPDASPVVYIDFNRPLRSQGLDVTIDGVTSTTAVSGERLTITLGSLLKDGQTYALRIGSISSTSNDHITNQTIQLHAQYVTYDQLPPEIQNLIASRQDVLQPTNRNAIPLFGSDALVTNGLSQFQLDAFKQALFLYSQSTKAAITSAVIDTASILPLLPGPHDPAGQFTLKFRLAINGVTYQAVLHYSGVSVARLLLLTSSGKLVYDSKTIDDTKL